jgi:hypothetical protein
MVFTGLAFGRIVSDTSWQVSPRNFIATAVVALLFWVAFFVALWKPRARILVVSRRRWPSFRAPGEWSPQASRLNETMPLLSKDGLTVLRCGLARRRGRR